ncbi:MAG: metallophosphoesterase family protein, partial [Polyangiales bacterium]
MQVDRLGCDPIVCLGDLVDEGLHPTRTVAMLRERAIPTIRGNHDRWALASGTDHAFRPLADSVLAFLGTLPTSWSAVVDGVRVVAWRARPGSDMRGLYADGARHELRAALDEARADVLIVGHTHESM